MHVIHTRVSIFFLFVEHFTGIMRTFLSKAEKYSYTRIFHVLFVFKIDFDLSSLDSSHYIIVIFQLIAESPSLTLFLGVNVFMVIRPSPRLARCCTVSYSYSTSLSQF